MKAKKSGISIANVVSLESLSGNREDGGNHNGIRYDTCFQWTHGSDDLYCGELDLGGVAHAEKIREQRSSIVRTIKIRQRVRVGPSLTAAKPDGLFDPPSGTRFSETTNI
jgi:hypothetical protein